jgi:hypothetical protein
VEIMYRKEINNKLSQAIVEVLGHIIHDDYAQFVDPTQIKKNLSRIFKANEWEEEYILDDIVDKLVTARPALWHIRLRSVPEQNSIDDKNRDRWT